MHQPTHAEVGEEHAQQSSDRRKQETLDEHLLNEARLGCPHRLANAGFAKPSGHSDEKEVRNVHANHQQHGTDCREQQD